MSSSSMPGSRGSGTAVTCIAIHRDIQWPQQRAVSRFNNINFVSTYVIIFQIKIISTCSTTERTVETILMPESTKSATLLVVGICSAWSPVFPTPRQSQRGKQGCKPSRAGLDLRMLAPELKLSKVHESISVQNTSHACVNLNQESK